MDKNDGSFWLGVALVGLGIADAAFNPFSFATSPEFFGIGATMIGMGLGIKGSKPQKGGNDE